MRKNVTTSMGLGNYRTYQCPHCEGLIVQNKNDIVINREVGRLNLSDDVSSITFNFNCRDCKAGLQTSIEFNSKDKEIS